MAFFKKLRERMFKSSSRLEEGLEAIVQDGGTEDAAPPPDQASAPGRVLSFQGEAPDVVSVPGAAPSQERRVEAGDGPREGSAQREASAERTPLAAVTPDPGPEAVALADEAVARASDPPREPLSDPVREGPEPLPEPTREPDPTPEPVPVPDPVPTPEIPEPTPEPDSTPEPVEVPPFLDPEPEPEPQPDPRPEPGPAPRPDPGPSPEVPQPPEPGPPPAPVEVPDQSPDEQPDRAPEEVPVNKPGFFGRLMGRGGAAPAAPAPEPREVAPRRPPPQPAPSGPVVRRALDDEMLERLEELLIATDMGVDTALRVAANLADGHFGRRLSTPEIKRLLAAEVARIMEPVARPLPLYQKKPQVVLVVGVNGSGKTTTIGKLASQFRAAGKKVVIAAGDTFRAAAVEQLQVWGERAGVPVLTAPEGSDPASLAFDAMAKAEADGADLLMIDTAGRLQNRADLMEELAKIVRVIRKRDPDAPHNTLLVLDATTGQNALNQVETFQKLADVSGLVMTKLDGTARGGVLVALADRFGLPIHAIGVGEQIDDLAPFDPEDFAAALTGAELEEA